MEIKKKKYLKIKGEGQQLRERQLGFEKAAWENNHLNLQKNTSLTGLWKVLRSSENDNENTYNQHSSKKVSSLSLKTYNQISIVYFFSI